MTELDIRALKSDRFQSLGATLARQVQTEEGRAGRASANEEAALWRDSAEKRSMTIRERNKNLWVEHFFRMASSHKELARDYEQRAAQALEMSV